MNAIYLAATLALPPILPGEYQTGYRDNMRVSWYGDTCILDSWGGWVGEGKLLPSGNVRVVWVPPLGSENTPYWVGEYQRSPFGISGWSGYLGECPRHQMSFRRIE